MWSSTFIIHHHDLKEEREKKNYTKIYNNDYKRKKSRIKTRN